MDHGGVCTAMSLAKRLTMAVGADGDEHIVGRLTHERSDDFGPMSFLRRSPILVATGARKVGDAIEVGLVSINLEDVRVLCKGLSCPLT